MPIPVVPKSTDQPGVQPTPQELLPAELALNADNGILYARMADGTVLPVKARPLGGFGGRDPGTFDGGCCPPVVTEDGQVVPGVIGQQVAEGFRIRDISCAEVGACGYFVSVYLPAGEWAEALVLQGELTSSMTGEVFWADIAYTKGPFLRQSQDSLAFIRVDCDSPWFIATSSPPSWGDLQTVYQPANFGINAQLPTYRLRVVAARMFGANGRAWIHDGPIGRLPGGSPLGGQLPPVSAPYQAPLGLPSRSNGTYPGCCVCQPPNPPDPPDYGSYAVVDDGEDTRYDCIGGSCVANPARKYAVRWRFYPADGVSSFSTEAAAIAKKDALTTAGGQYATQAACESACVVGAWVVSVSGSTTRWRCVGASCGSQAYDTYSVAFVSGASATGPVSNGGSFATQPEANAWVASRTGEMLTAHPYATQADCQNSGACVASTFKCVTTTTNGVTTNACLAVDAADIPAALASGASLYPTSVACAQYCGAPSGASYAMDKCSTDLSEEATTAAQQLLQVQSAAQDLVERGWSNVGVVRAVQASTFVCGGATGPVISLSARCPGTVDYEDLGTQRPVLKYRATGSIGWLEDSFRAPRCVPNPAP